MTELPVTELPEDRDALLALRSEIIQKSTKTTCWLCKDPQKETKVMRYDDPITSACRCDKIQDWVDLMIAVEAKLGLKRR